MSMWAERCGHGMLKDQEIPAEDAVLVECTSKSWLDNIEPEKLQVLADMYDNQSCTDVVIQCCNHKLINAHRDVLAARSQLFNIALRKSSRKCAVLEVKYLPFKYIKALIDLIYHNQVLVARVDAGRMLYLMQQFQLRGAFGENGVEGLLLRLSGTKLLGEHFDHLFQYTYATPITKARLPRETLRFTSVAEPLKPMFRDRRGAGEPAAPINHQPPTTVVRELAVTEGVPIDQEKLKVEDVNPNCEDAPGLESGNTEVETVEYVDQKDVTINQKGHGFRRSRILIPTEASCDRFMSLAAPGEYPQPLRAASRRNEKKPKSSRPSLAALGEYSQPLRAVSRRSEKKPNNPRPVAVTSTPKAKVRTAAANAKLCFDALVCGSSQYTNVDTDGKKIPRPPNAFMIFGQDFRKLLAEENPGDSNKVVSVALGHAWGMLTDCERQAYYDLQELYKQEHQARYPGYVYCPAHARQQKALRRRT